MRLWCFFVFGFLVLGRLGGKIPFQPQRFSLSWGLDLDLKPCGLWRGNEFAIAQPPNHPFKSLIRGKLKPEPPGGVGDGPGLNHWHVSGPC